MAATPSPEIQASSDQCLVLFAIQIIQIRYYVRVLHFCLDILYASHFFWNRSVNTSAGLVIHWRRTLASPDACASGQRLFRTDIDECRIVHIFVVRRDLFTVVALLYLRPEFTLVRAVISFMSHRDIDNVDVICNILSIMR